MAGGQNQFKDGLGRQGDVFQKQRYQQEAVHAQEAAQRHFHRDTPMEQIVTEGLQPEKEPAEEPIRSR